MCRCMCVCVGGCVFDPNQYQLDLCNELCLSGQLSVLHGKNFNVGCYRQSFQSDSFWMCSD